MKKSLTYIYEECSLLSEFVTKAQLREVEKFADKLFAKIGVDVELTGRHFYDRLNDIRNSKDITTVELISLFKKTFQTHGKKISDMKAGIEAVIKDMNSNLNIPFIIKWDKLNKEFDLVAKTILRKKNFKTSDITLKI